MYPYTKIEGVITGEQTDNKPFVSSVGVWKILIQKLILKVQS